MGRQRVGHTIERLGHHREFEQIGVELQDTWARIQRAQVRDAQRGLTTIRRTNLAGASNRNMTGELSALLDKMRSGYPQLKPTGKHKRMFLPSQLSGSLQDADSSEERDLIDIICSNECYAGPHNLLALFIVRSRWYSSRKTGCWKGTHEDTSPLNFCANPTLIRGTSVMELRGPGDRRWPI